jgi:hypothetical protein
MRVTLSAIGDADDGNATVAPQELNAMQADEI